MIPLSLYVHIPWCEKKCPYCDFNSHVPRTEVDEEAYVTALLKDLQADLTTFENALERRSIHSIFIGGGTPSLFSAAAIHRLLLDIQQHCDLTDDIEITLEANPGSAEAEKFAGFRDAGVNRLSIGAQSFNGAMLAALGRVHDQSEAIAAAGYAHDAGFDRINLDVMFGLPDQSLQQCLEDIEQALALNTTHLSCYQLTLEPNTLFHHSPPPVPDSERLWEMQTVIQQRLADADFQQYEVSAYARDHHRCRHNLNYWQFGDYLGIGAGAHGKITQADGRVVRNWKIKHPQSYLQRSVGGDSTVGGQATVDQQALPFEFMLNALRLSDGFHLDLYEQRTHLPLSSIMPILTRHQDQGLANIDCGHVHLSARGRDLIDSLLQDYLPESNAQ